MQRLRPRISAGIIKQIIKSKRFLFTTANSDRSVRIVIDTNPLFCYKKAVARIAGTAKRQKNGRRNRFPGNRRTGGRLPRKKEPDSRVRALLCVNASLEKKAKELVILNVSGISSFADYFILCSGTSDRQVRAIAAAIQENLKKTGMLPLGVEGEAGGKWVLLDYDDVIIHVFLESVRTFYDLERLWSETPRMAVPDETASLKGLAEGM
ncbi:MAG: ribosome silencing factor [Proteobacteria bacterium]|nr:ribosome silencing factor [Pseudomonadota bacterium]